jgi:hypothetical protein
MRAEIDFSTTAPITIPQLENVAAIFANQGPNTGRRQNLHHTAQRTAG